MNMQCSEQSRQDSIPITVKDESDNIPVTLLLRHWQNGDHQALQSLIDHAYAQLKRVAHRLMGRENRFRTLQTSALVHEGYLRLIELKNLHWESREQFFSAWAGIMRRVLIDYARAQTAQKRGGNRVRVTMTENLLCDTPVDLVDLQDALSGLHAYDSLLCQLVELRYFAGFTNEEVATALDMSVATVKRKWLLAKAWLYRELQCIPEKSEPEKCKQEKCKQT